MQGCHGSILKFLKSTPKDKQAQRLNEQNRDPLSLTTLLLTEQRDSSPSGGNEGQGAKTTLFDQFSTKERRIGIKLARGDKRRGKIIYPPATGAEATSELI